MKYIGDGTWVGGIEKVKQVIAESITTYQDNEQLGYFSVVLNTPNYH